MLAKSRVLMYQIAFGQIAAETWFEVIFSRMQTTHIMLRDLLTQKCVNKKKVTDFGYTRECTFRKYQIENRLWELPLPTFFKTDLSVYIFRIYMPCSGVFKTS
jgi:hypothetical protein